MTAGPLDGVRVVEITMFQQGPVAGMRLGDLGADVIKIEAKTGDPKRVYENYWRDGRIIRSELLL